jgi:hypothetical protein
MRLHSVRSWRNTFHYSRLWNTKLYCYDRMFYSKGLFVGGFNTMVLEGIFAIYKIYSFLEN